MPEDQGPNSTEMRASEQEFAEARHRVEEDSEEAIPEIDFSMFVLSLSHSALVHLGDAPNPGTGTQDVSLPMARQTIDLLALLQEKAKGNLTGEEERILDQALYDLRMRYVEVAKAK